MQENSKKSIHRLIEFITSKGVSLNKLSIDLGLSNSYFSKMVRNSGSIGSDIIEKIIRIYPDLNAEWLLTGYGDMIKDVPSLERVKIDPECPPILSPSCPGQEKKTNRNVNESSTLGQLQQRINQKKEEGVNNWNSEDYISDNDKSNISFVWDTFDKSAVRSLYQLSIRALSNKIGILKQEIADLYDDEYLLIEGINQFKLGSYSSKFVLPPKSDQRIKTFQNEFEQEFGDIENKRLKAVFFLLELEDEADSLRSSIHSIIKTFNHASHFISIYHRSNLPDENGNQN